MRVRLLMVAALIGVLSLAATGCAQITAKLTPPDKIVTREATVAVAAAAVEGTFQTPPPEGLPLWPTAKVVPAESPAPFSAKSWDETLLAADPFDLVLAGMVTGLQKGGWKVEAIDASTPDAQTSILNVVGNGSEGVITISETPEGTRIDYTIAPSK
jgi:hypothetical protein